MPPPSWNTETGRFLVVRIAGKVYVVPMRRLEEFASHAMQNLSPEELEAFFASHDKVEAATAGGVTILNGDIAPPYPP